MLDGSANQADFALQDRVRFLASFVIETTATIHRTIFA